MTLTNIGTSSYARISSIRSEEKLHWYLGLRQAELEIETNLRPALEDTFMELEILSQAIEDIQKQSILLTKDRIEILKLQRQKARLELLIPGAMAELQTAEAERDRIISEHDVELATYSKDDLENLVSRDCYLARCHYVLASAQIRPMGFNDAESQLYLSLPPEDQIAVMTQLQMHNAGEIASLANALGKVSPEAAKRIVQIVEKEVTEVLMIGGSN